VPIWSLDSWSATTDALRLPEANHRLGDAEALSMNCLCRVLAVEIAWRSKGEGDNQIIIKRERFFLRCRAGNESNLRDLAIGERRQTNGLGESLLS
jgi:hypothetical protein